jgi:hypothetical protein
MINIYIKSLKDRQIISIHWDSTMKIGKLYRILSQGTNISRKDRPFTSISQKDLPNSRHSSVGLTNNKHIAEGFTN